MDVHSRRDFDQRKNADAKCHLFYQKSVSDNGIHTLGYRIGKKEPGNKTAEQPKDKRGFPHAGLGPKTYFKNEPDDRDKEQRAYKCPNGSQIRTEILFFEITMCQSQKQPSAFINMFYKAEKLFKISHFLQSNLFAFIFRPAAIPLVDFFNPFTQFNPVLPPERMQL